ncbi:MAG: HPr family phosphocarrier protein [Deltaproteobacteria bacterium]|jgi:phosphocarrier protein|nr:HPr family phosphocarrier protein [Deltaproteobacteria bacterium]
MRQTQVVIADEYGIHARPASIVVKKAQELSCEITIEKGIKTADAKRLLAVLQLSAEEGDTLTIITEGEDEESALEAIVTAFKETGLS